MNIERVWKNLTHDLIDSYEKTVESLHQRIEKFELDNHLKGPPVAPSLPYVQLHDDSVNKVITKPGNYSEIIDVNGKPRHFILHVPEGYNASKNSAAIPLVVALHGFTQNASEFEVFSDLDKDADKRKAAVLYPEATQWLGVDIAAAWDTGNGLTPLWAHADDIGFIKKAISTTELQIKVDRNRVGLMGVSNGGMEAYKAATEMSGTFAAVVVISGAMSGHEKAPPNPISVMSVVGTKDDIVPPDGRTKKQEISVVTKEALDILSTAVSEKWKHFFSSDEGQKLGTFVVRTSNFAPTFKPVSYATDFWKKVDHIDGKPVEYKKGNVLTDYYENKKTGVAVEQVVLTGMDHAAQGGVPREYRLNDEAWAFLSSHPKYHQPIITPPAAIRDDHAPRHTKHYRLHVHLRQSD